MRAALFTLACCAALAGASAQTIHRVDPDAVGGLGDGTSWDDAFLDLQVALASAAPGDVLLLAEGTYVPGTQLSDAFIIRAGLTLRGCHAGAGAPDPDRRDLALYPTVLSGDVLGDDTGGFGNRTDNVVHVVVAPLLGSGTAPIVLDGLTVRGGHAVYGSVSSWGAGLFGNPDGTLVFRDCLFTDNLAAQWGAGAFLQLGDVTMLRCGFTGNRVQADTGDPAADPVGGAGLTVYDCDIELLGCSFEDNRSRVFGSGTDFDILGGGAFIGNVTQPFAVDHCTFLGNRVVNQGTGGSRGAGLVAWQQGRVADGLFEANILDAAFSGAADDGGGGAFLGGSVHVVNSRFLGNAATNSRGGGLFITDTGFPSPDVTLAVNNCEFSGNTGGWGAGLFFDVSTVGPSGFREVANTVISRNTATGHGGGARATSQVRFANSILWGNRDCCGSIESMQVTTLDPGLPRLSWCIVEGYTGTYPGGNCLAADPLLADDDGADDTVGTLDDDLTLLAGSPAIDSGSNARIIDDFADLDRDGNTSEQVPVEAAGLARRADDPATADGGHGNPPIVDRGAHEFGSPLPDQQWTDLGSALAGTHGDPLLVGRGTLTAFTKARLTLSNALENTSAVLVIGFTAIHQPYKGGTLVPSPDVLVFGLPTGPTGTLDLLADWLAAEFSGLSFYYQYWIDDPAAPSGWSASNSVLGATP